MMVNTNALEEQLKRLALETASVILDAIRQRRLRLSSTVMIREGLEVVDSGWLQMSARGQNRFLRLEMHPEDLRNLFRNRVVASEAYTSTLRSIVETGRSEQMGARVIHGLWMALTDGVSRSLTQPAIAANQATTQESQTQQPTTDIRAIIQRVSEAIMHIESRFADNLPAPQDLIADSIGRLVEYALNDILHDTVVWDIKMWFTGLSTGNRTTRVRASLLRPCIPEDLVFESRAGEKTFWDKDMRVVPISVLETAIESHDAHELHREETRLDISLRLLRPSVFCTHVFYSPRSLVEVGSRGGSLQPRDQRPVTVTDANEVSYHLGTLPSLIPDDLLKGTCFPTTHLAMAYASYDKASDERLPPHDVVAECIKGLQALYKKPWWRTNIGARLAPRVARALKAEGLDQKTVKVHIGVAYSRLRNLTEHGIPIDREDMRLASELASPLLEYLRRGIVLRINGGDRTETRVPPTD